MCKLAFRFNPIRTSLHIENLDSISISHLASRISTQSQLAFRWLAVLHIPTLSWQQAVVLGGSGSEHLKEITRLTPGSVLLSGYFFSQQLTLGSHTLTSAGGADVWVAVLDTQNCKWLWAGRMGGADGEYLQ